MHKGNIKLPDDYMLRQLLEQGMDPAAIAVRFGCARETVRNRIVKAGLADLRATPERKQASKKFAAVKPGIDLLEEKIVFTTEVTAGDCGGTARRSVSLPRLSMHVAALREAGRC